MAIDLDFSHVSPNALQSSLYTEFVQDDAVLLVRHNDPVRVFGLEGEYLGKGRFLGEAPKDTIDWIRTEIIEAQGAFFHSVIDCEWLPETVLSEEYMALLDARPVFDVMDYKKVLLLRETLWMRAIGVRAHPVEV